MSRKVTNVLFVSRENACRGLLAEACLNHLGQGRFKAFSCGIPARIAERPNGFTLLALQTAAIPALGLSCKSWSVFTRNSAPKMDFVIGLDEETFNEHPAWPGQPVTASWDYPKVFDKKLNSQGAACVRTLMSLRLRLELLVSLHAKSKNRFDLQHDLRDLGHVGA